MIQLIEAEKRNRNSRSNDARIYELVNRFLKLADPELKNGFFREEPFNGTTLKIEAGDSGLRIAYEFTETEVAILQTLSEVTGVSLNWLAKDAITWTRGYISGLVQSLTGSLRDLIDAKDGDCPVPASHRSRTTAFLQAYAGNGLPRRAIPQPSAHCRRTLRGNGHWSHGNVEDLPEHRYTVRTPEMYGGTAKRLVAKTSGF